MVRPAVSQGIPRAVSKRAGSRSPEGDGGAGALEGSLGLLRNVLGNLLQDRLRGAVDEVLGLLQAEVRQREIGRASCRERVSIDV